MSLKEVADEDGTHGFAAKPKSFAPEVIADDSGKWCGNSLRFATEKEAQVWVEDLSFRWILVRETRVVPSDDEPNYRLTEVEPGLWRKERIDADGKAVRS